MHHAPAGPPRRAESAPSRRPLRWLLAALGAAAALLLLGRAAGGLAPAVLGWVEARGAWGPAVFVLGYALLTVALVPGSILTLAAGALFGLVWGTAYVMVGATAGAAAAFLIARHLARPAVARRLEGDARFARVDRAIEREGGKIALLLRLSPAFPFALLNYALGLTRIHFGSYLLASVGMLPATVMYVYYGKVAGDVAAVVAGSEVRRGPGYWLLLGLGLAATVAVTVLLTRTARRALDQETADEGHAPPRP